MDDQSTKEPSNVELRDSQLSKQHNIKKKLTFQGWVLEVGVGVG